MIYFFVVLVLFIILYGRPITEKWKIIRYLLLYYSLDFWYCADIESGLLGSFRAMKEFLSLETSSNWEEIRNVRKSFWNIILIFYWASPRIILELAKKVREESNEELVKIWVLSECVFFPFTGKMLQVLSLHQVYSINHSVYSRVKRWDQQRQKLWLLRSLAGKRIAIIVSSIIHFILLKFSTVEETDGVERGEC